MGKLNELCRKTWQHWKDACHSTDDLRNALERHDLQGALNAISHAKPDPNLYEDTILSTIADYAEEFGHDHGILKNIREAVYHHYDTKIRFKHEDARSPELAFTRRQTGYMNPAHVYGMAAYMNDTEKLRELHEKGVHPDEASDRALSENVIMGTIRLKRFAAMKEVILQGASMTNAFGFDEFPPIHYLPKHLFHDIHAGVTTALLETGILWIRQEIVKGLGEEDVRRRERIARKPHSMHPKYN